MIDEAMIAEAMIAVGADTKDQCIHRWLDDKFLINHCGHYLIHGSEYLMALTGCLKHQRLDLTQVLRKIGKPTMIVCDIAI